MPYGGEAPYGDYYYKGDSVFDRYLTISNGGNSTLLPAPQWDYAVTVDFPFIRTKLGRALGYATYDPGIGYDIRTCKAQWILDKTLMAAFMTFARTDSQAFGRGCNVTLSLGTTPTGFYIGGPDLGDVGNWTVQIISMESEGIGSKPYLRFRLTLEFLIVTPPAYSIPTPRSQGRITIGTVTGLPFPQGWFKPKSEYAIRTMISRSGAPSVMDAGESADEYETTFDFAPISAGNAGNLVAYLVASGRATDMTLTTAANQYAFGNDRGAADDYTVQMLNDKLEIRHFATNQFGVELDLYCKPLA